MPAKIARLATRPPFWIPEVSVAVRSSRPSCGKAEKREYSWRSAVIRGIPVYTKSAGDMRVYWQGPTLGFDAGADGARTMMLVYNLPRTEAIFERFGGVDGSAYLVGGFGMTALITNDIVVVPIRSGGGVRLGANL